MYAYTACNNENVSFKWMGVSDIIRAWLAINIAQRSAHVTEHSPGPSVCLSVRKVYCGKTADWILIQMPFGMMNGVKRLIVTDGAFVA